MLARELDDMRAYRDKLRAYSTEEIEDIYFHINILRQPLRYQVLKLELESRRLQPPVSSTAVRAADLRRWVETRPFFRRHPALRVSFLSALIFLLTSIATAALFAPIWLFAMPLRFVGFQTAVVYVACAPLAPIFGTAFGIRIGGRGVYGIPVLLGVAAGTALFNATGAPAAILRMILQPQATGGGFFGGF